MSEAKNYQVLARKYRPQTFEDMIGQEPMVKTLTNAFALGRIAHAFMLTGVRGIGKTTTARLLARALNYESETHSGPSVKLDPPGKHCEAINKSAHLDVMEMDAASRTGVGDIREILDSVRYGPVEARYKIYIIDEVHMLSTAAFNALLKTLEEPPEHAKFIFATTEIRKIPITVLSRCQRFDLKRVDADELAEHLANICKKEKSDIEMQGLKLIARAAEGSVRDGLSLLDQAMVQAKGEKTVTAEDIRTMLGLADRTRVLDLLAYAISADSKAVLGEARSQYDDGADPIIILRDLLEICHELSRAKILGQNCEFDMATDQIARLHKLAKKTSMGQITRIWQILLGANSDIRTAPNPLAALEMTLLRLCVAQELPPPELVTQIIENINNSPEQPSQNKKSQNTTTNTSAQISEPTQTLSASNNLSVSALVSERPLERPLSEENKAQKTEIKDLQSLVANLPKSMAGLRYNVEKYIRPIRMQAGTLVFSLAPGAPKDLDYKLRSWLTETTKTPWHVKIDHKTQGSPSIIEARREKKQKLEEFEKNHPLAKKAREIFADAKIEFRDRAPISNIVVAGFNKNES